MPSDDQGEVNAASQTKAHVPGPKAEGAVMIDLAESFYLLNPGGDLPATQQTFQSWLEQQPSWQVGFVKFVAAVTAGHDVHSRSAQPMKCSSQVCQVCRL